MKMQRTKQTVIFSLGVGVNTRLVAADSSRAYIGFFIPAGGNQYNLNTTPIVPPNNPGWTMPSATSLPLLEFWFDRHGLFPQLEWWGSGNAGAGVALAIVLELFEWEAGERKSPGGVILGSDGGLLSPLNGASGDRATILRQAIESTIRTVQRGKA